jgi:hypothetical protein
MLICKLLWALKHSAGLQVILTSRCCKCFESDNKPSPPTLEAVRTLDVPGRRLFFHPTACQPSLCRVGRSREALATQLAPAGASVIHGLTQAHCELAAPLVLPTPSPRSGHSTDVHAAW